MSWNVCDKLKENLQAIYKSIINQGEEKIYLEVFVVDNNSKDNSVQMIRDNFPQVILIGNTENLGFARANNQAIKKATGEFILLLNPDMKVLPDTFLNILKWAKNNHQASVIGCNLIDEKNKNIKHVRRFPTFFDQLVIVLKLPHVFPKLLKKYIIENFDYSQSQKVDSIRGGFFLIRKEIEEKIKLKIKLDERYFVWFEEVDFCKQVYQNGGEVWYTSAAKCIDYVGQSFGQLPRKKAQKYFRDSQLKYFKKWHSKIEYITLKIAWLVIYQILNLISSVVAQSRFTKDTNKIN